MLPDFLSDLCKKQSYNPDNFFLIAGPCVVESEEMVMEIADKVYSICKRLEIPYIFKASYRKANRTSANSFTGLGDDTGLELIKKVSLLKMLTDVKLSVLLKYTTMEKPKEVK